MSRINKLRDSILKQYMDSLQEDADKIVKEASTSKEAKNISKNQLDAYGWAIYYNGRLMRKGYATNPPKSEGEHKGWAKHGIEPNTGRGYVDDYFNQYRPPTKNLTLIVVNAIYYSKILEEGKQSRAGTTYKILSQIASDFEKLKTKYIK